MDRVPYVRIGDRSAYQPPPPLRGCPARSIPSHASVPDGRITECIGRACETLAERLRDAHDAWAPCVSDRRIAARVGVTERLSEITQTCDVAQCRLSRVESADMMPRVAAVCSRSPRNISAGFASRGLPCVYSIAPSTDCVCFFTAIRQEGEKTSSCETFARSCAESCRRSLPWLAYPRQRHKPRNTFRPPSWPPLLAPHPQS